MSAGIDFTSTQEKLADRIFDGEIMKFGAFKLKLHEKNPEAPLSPIYINLRKPPEGLLTDKDIKIIGTEMYVMVRRVGIAYDLLTGIPRAGLPFAERVAELSGKPLIKLGKKEEGGTRKIDSIIEGDYRPGQSIFLLDDLLTQADTKKEAIAVCEAAGLVVVGVGVLLDREQGGAEDLAKAGYLFRAVFLLLDLLEYYVRTGRISKEKQLEVMDYIANNR